MHPPRFRLSTRAVSGSMGAAAADGGVVLPGDPVRVRCHRLKDGSDGCLLGFVTPLHGDPARGHGVEKEWD